MSKIHFFLTLFVLTTTLVACKNEVEKKEEKIIYFAGNNPLIQRHGRFQENGGAIKSWAPGSYFEFTYFGKKCDVYLTDEIRFNTHNYLEIVIDSLPPKRIKLDEATTILHLGKKLKNDQHHVLICKNTESNIGYLQLNHIKCAQLLPTKKTRFQEIEFIGNSITCGNGSDFSLYSCAEGKWYDQHNAYMSFGALIARRFNANWTLSAVSGIGLTRNCCGIKNTMPEVYNRIAFKKKSDIWRFGKNHPALICISLGQNDGVQKESIYVNTYVSFIHTLQALHPKAEIICCTSPMANLKLKQHLEKCILKVEKKVNRKKNRRPIHHYFYPKRYAGGCSKHPTLKEHQAIAKELGDYIENLNILK